MASIEGKLPERPVYERLFRALSRIEADFDLPRCLTGSELGDQHLSILTNYDHRPVQAAEFLRAQLINTTTKMDVLSWALIMTSALHRGAGWLDVDVNDSKVWQAMLPLLLMEHFCDEDTNCDQSRKELVTLTVKFPFGLDKFPLTILDGDGTEQPVSLMHAIQRFMFPSFTKLVLNEYSSSARARFPPNLPSHLAIQLNLMTSHTVRAHDLWKEDLWQRIELFVGIEPTSGHDTLHQHPSIVMPLFNALLDVVCAYDFIETDTLTPGQKMDVCLFLFRTFNLEPNLQPHMCFLLTPTILVDILGIAFHPSIRLPSPLITDILNFLTSSMSHLSADVYRLLRERQWLDEIERTLAAWPNAVRPRQEHYYDLSYPFLACAYVNGLETLSYLGPAEYRSTLEYLTSSNLFRISKHVLFADADRRKLLHRLSSIVGEMTWSECGKALSAFVETDGWKAKYEYHATKCSGYDPFNWRILLQYGPYNNLKDFLHQTMPQQSESGKTIDSTSSSHGYPPKLSESITMTSQRSNSRQVELLKSGTQTEIV